MSKSETLNYRLFLVTRKNLLWTMVLGITGALIIILAIIPQVNQVLTLRSTLGAEKPKLAKLDSKLAELDNILFTPEYSQIDLVSDALPSKKPLLELLDSLNSAAGSTQVTIVKFSLSPGLVASDSAELLKQLQKSGDKKSYDNLELDLQLKGQFSQMQDFMETVERFAPFTSVTQFSLSEQRSDSSQANFEPDSIVTVKMSTETYFFTQSINVTIDSPLPKIGDTEREVLEQLQLLKASDLPDQNKIEGGGLEDLFGVEGYDFTNLE